MEIVETVVFDVVDTFGGKDTITATRSGNGPWTYRLSDGREVVRGRRGLYGVVLSGSRFISSDPNEPRDESDGVL